MPTDKRRVAVIGSGFGGLAVAIRLQAAGYQTVIFEKRDRPGGRAYVYHDHGFTFDAGPTVITAPIVCGSYFSLAGKSMDDYVELMPVNPFYRLFWEDGYQFDYSADSRALEDQIRKKSPQDLAGYKKFLKYSEEVFHEGFEKLAHVPFLTLSSMVSVAPQLSPSRGVSFGLQCRFEIYPGSAFAAAIQFPFTFGGRESLHDDIHLHAYSLPRTEVGRLLSKGWDGSAGPGVGETIAGSRG